MIQNTASSIRKLGRILGNQNNFFQNDRQESKHCRLSPNFGMKEPDSKSRSETTKMQGQMTEGHP